MDLTFSLRNELNMSTNRLGINIKPQLGGDIEAYCGKCKDTREHVIAALNADGYVERVQCRTCQSNHLFRQKAAKTASTKTSSAKSSRKETALDPDGNGPLRTYSMHDKFSIGDRIDHPKFGVGVVVDVRFGKIDVKFGREQRVLIHGA
jgi:transposase-like protein